MCKNDSLISRGDLYWALLSDVDTSKSADDNVQKGRRPVVVVQNNAGNIYSQTIIVAPITSRHKKMLPVHVAVTKEETGLPLDSVVLLEQITTINKNQLSDFIGKVNLNTMQRIDKAIEISIL